MIKIYISHYRDVYHNVAIERYLFSHSKKDLILFLWQNKPCVVFGRNQNVFNEVNIDYAKSHDIDLVRRFSGGGAVYQDEGNLNYTFIYNGDEDIEYLNEIILKTFKNLGFNAYFSGRNDLLIDGKKFSGIAYCNDFDHIMYHGTCLIDVSLNNLVNVLKPHDYKLKTHSVESYRSRVINLKEIKDITINEISNSFINTLKDIDEAEVINEINLNEEINKTIALLKDENYIFNDCPGYTYSLDLRLNNSNYHFDVEYKDGEIINVNCYSDDLDINKKEKYIKLLMHKKIAFNDLKDYLLATK